MTHKRMGQYRVNDHPYHAPQFSLRSTYRLNIGNNTAVCQNCLHFGLPVHKNGRSVYIYPDILCDFVDLNFKLTFNLAHNFNIEL